MKAAKKFAFDVGWVFAGSMVVLLLHFLQKPIMARYLGPDGLGLFSMVTMIAGTIALVVGVGIDGAVVKYVAEYKNDKSKLHAILSSAFITVAILGVVASIVLFMLSDKLAGIFDMPSLSYLLKIYAFVLPFSLVYGVILGSLNGLREMKYYSLFNTLNGIMIFLFIVTFLFLGFGVVGAVIGDMLALIVVLIIAGVITRKFVHFTITDYRKNTKKLTSFGSRLMGVSSINLLYTQADILLIGYFLTVSDVGYYAAAVSLSRFFWRVPQSVQMVTYPATSEYLSEGKQESLNKMIDKSMKYSACILLITGLGVWFFAKDIVTFLFGDEFIYAVLPLQILLIGTVINGATSRPIGGSLAGAGRPELDLIKVSVTATVNVLLNVLLIPRFGVVGAAMATAISLSLASGLGIFFIIRTLHVKIDFKWFVKAFGMGFASILIFTNLGGVNRYILGCTILFICVLLILKFLLTQEDREMLKSLYSIMYVFNKKK
jgi:O-antigen/teichoic acid export membrane protein